MTADGGEESPSSPTCAEGTGRFERRVRKEGGTGREEEAWGQAGSGQGTVTTAGRGLAHRKPPGFLVLPRSGPSPTPRAEDRALASGGPTVRPSQTGPRRGCSLEPGGTCSISPQTRARPCWGGGSAEPGRTRSGRESVSIPAPSTVPTAAGAQEALTLSMNKWQVGGD